MTRRIDRRTFLGVASAVALSACDRRRLAPLGEGTGSAALEDQDGAMPTRPLGQTGVNVSIVGLGGYHLGLASSEAECVRTIRSAVDRGMTFMDNAWDYNDGRSEEWMGKALQDGWRQRAFLMTKLDGRTKKAANDQLEQSLRRLQTDMVDLVQIHEVIRESDPEACFAEGGVVEALVDARKAGKLRFIGFTGHKDPRIHLAMLDAADRHGFRFDTVQLPLNVLDPHYQSFQERVLPVLTQKHIGVLGMKPLSSGKILEAKLVSAPECLRYALSLPTSVVITGCERMDLVDQAVRAAVGFQPMSDEERRRLLDRTREAAKDGHLERFKTSHDHDSTYYHPEWLGTRA